MQPQAPENQERQRPCERCGMLGRWTQEHGMCPPCADPDPVQVAKEVTYWVDGTRMVCRPHRGDFDANDNPVYKDGRPYKPGERTCGHRDCVAANHIISASVVAA